MSSVVISGNTSGTITLSAPDVSGSNTLDAWKAEIQAVKSRFPK